jgi:hypothetical protein
MILRIPGSSMVLTVISVAFLSMHQQNSFDAMVVPF